MNTTNFKKFLERHIEKVDELELFKVLDFLPPLDVDGVWIAGGAIRRTIIGDKLDSDFDFFFRNEDLLNRYCKELESMGGIKINENEHQMTYSIMFNDNKILVQLIKISFYPSLHDVLDSFDFTITQFGFDGKNLVYGEYSLWDLARRKLVVHKLTYGVATMRRIIKYTRQGFTACSGMFADLLERVVENPKIIESDIKYID